MHESIDPNIKTKVHYFRKFEEGFCDTINCQAESHEPDHGALPGMHGKDKKYCKACVVAVVCVITKGEWSYVGVSFRNPKDQFNRKIGRAIAIGRAKKNLERGISVDGFTLAKDIEYCYDNPLTWIKGCLRHYLPKKD